MLTKLLSRLGYEPKRTAPALPPPKRLNGAGIRMAIAKSAESAEPNPYFFPIKPPELLANVTPAGVTPLIAADSTIYTLAGQSHTGSGFPGYAYLSSLSTRAEFRAMASGMATELTREWIELTSSEDDNEKTREKLPLILKELERHNVQGVIQKAAEHDCYFGRAQIFIDVRGAERGDPLILDKRTVAKGSFLGVKAVEAMWTTPSAYNALDPSAPDFYCPAKWYMLGREVHASRMVTVISRPVPDMLKPAFNFGGISLSQLAEPYVDNWLRTRQSVSDLLNNFSTTVLATSMDEVLSGDEGASAALFDRATLFTATRSNRGIMLLDKEREELTQINTPLSGVHELQAQSQEQMCAVSRMPAIILTGISPGGLNASSDSEIRVFYDWIAAQQSAYWRTPIDTILKVIQLSLFGEIDEDISFSFRPLYQMTPDQEATIRKSNAEAATSYINAGVIDPSEERQRLASDPQSGYTGLDMGVEIVPPTEPGADETDPDEEPPAKDSAAELVEFMNLYAKVHGIEPNAPHA